jgi:peptidoglycan hydrolase-like protein with peptidoglycan-binding domain
VPKHILTLLTILSLTLFTAGAVQASWLDKLKETATELTDKAGEVLKEAEPGAPSTSDGEGQPQSPATASPAKPAAPKTQTVTKPAAPKAAQPAPVANTGNNNKTLVRNIQQELKRLGYNIGVDGAYGPNTKKQIIAFEQSQSLEPSGDASVELLAKLKETPTPAAKPAATTTTAATPAPAPAPKAAEPKAAPAPAPKAAEATAPEPKVEQAAAPKKSLNPHDYDRAYLYEGGAPQLEGAWLLIKDRQPAHFYAEIKGDELLAQHSLSGMQLPPGVKIDIREELATTFRKTDSYDPPSVVMIRFGGKVITAKNVSQGGSTKLRFHAEGPEVAALLAHVQDGKDFEFRIDKFEPFLYSEDWTTFSSPPPEIAAAKQAEKEKQAAAMAAQKAEQEKKAAYAGTLNPEAKMAFERCEQNHTSSNFYSCQCIAENIEGYIRPAMDRRTENWRKRISGYEGAIKKNNANPNFTAEKKAQMEESMRQQIKSAEEEIAKVEDRAGWDDRDRKVIVQSAELNIYKNPLCKVGEFWRKKEYDGCMQSSNSKNIKGKTPEEFCRCSADTVVNLWTKSERSYGSSVAVSLATQARGQCRK